jgi:DNA-directed RNA polymerase subunit RPC12/RpoP
MESQGSTVATVFECEECGHEWPAPEGWASNPGRHDYDRCPNCGADGGENCWDCGEPNEDTMGFDMCGQCHVTVCDDCQRGTYEGAHECDRPRGTLS